MNDAYTCHEWNFNHNGLTNEISRPDKFENDTIFVTMLVVLFILIIFLIFMR